MNKKLVFFICLIGIILSAACVSAAEDVGQTGWSNRYWGYK